eukprot:CAMPEP_0113462736 /NCGR_PEP_ID=MMETSP0014_2-20120614/12265_1 /TAXON_ID=2857 /ORGANISM="Nitzschia sp." /LENGTH=316 /DNA_ID=CAMNT_0000354647 /DNA_START=326 /DNA_END=1276 /DNA_ORIENTATION=+ /assembly_acc=CAM_ASM_000159
MTETYGIHSPQAKLAWEAVEEFDGRDNSAAYEPRWDRMMSDEQRQQAYEELQYTLEVLQRDRPHSSHSGGSSVRRFAHNPELMDDIATELQSIKLSPPSKKPPPKIPGLWDAKLKARAMSQQFGNDSVEAKLAWEEVEELASAGLDNAIGESSYQTCDVGQAAEACLALEELDRFLYFEDQYNGVVGGDDDEPIVADYPIGGGLVDDGGRYQDSGGSSNYVGGYHDNVNDNGGPYVNGDINNYIDGIDNGRNYQEWNHHYDDDGRGGGGSGGGRGGGFGNNYDIDDAVGGSSSSSGQSHFDERRSGGYTSYNEDPY